MYIEREVTNKAKVLATLKHDERPFTRSDSNEREGLITRGESLLASSVIILPYQKADSTPSVVNFTFGVWCLVWVRKLKNMFKLVGKKREEK